MTASVRKRADDRLDYDLDFERWLSDGDIVLSADAVAEIVSNDPSAVTDLVVDSVQVFGTVVKVWLSAGTTGKTYKVTVTATTADGRDKEQPFIIRVTEC